MKSILYIILSLSFIFCSCQGKIEDSLLLQGHEYKLWYIENENENRDSLEWFNLDLLKLESFWTEYGGEKEHDQWDSEYAYYIAINHYGLEKQRKFRKKRNIPEFLYIDRDGYVCILALDRWTGDFVEKQDTEMTGIWKLKNDSVMIINKNRYLLKKTDKKSNTLMIRNMKTSRDMKLTDTNFPPPLHDHKAYWTDKEEKEHREKWGYGIKQSPLLQGYDYKLWRNKKDYGYHNYLKLLMFERDTTYIWRDYYYCNFIYLDKCGRYTDLYLSGDGWHIRISPWCNDLTYTYEYEYENGRWSSKYKRWHPNGNDSIPIGFKAVQIMQNSGDTLYLRELNTNEDLCYIAVNLPPKSKNKKFKK
jgi:hypothetical protein